MTAAAEKHTPTPWAWSEGTPHITSKWNGEDRVIARVSTSGLQWHENANSASREAGANAAFIVRAVNAHDDMLAALKSLEMYAPDVGVDQFHDALRAARAAIAKASPAA